MSTVTTISTSKVGGGTLKRIQHESESTGTSMIFGLFLPSGMENSKDVIPALFWLSGLTCDDTNFEMKAGPKAFEAAQKAVSKRTKLILLTYFEISRI